jgi:signal transduction histidine kinase
MLELMNKFFELAKLESGDADLPLTQTNLNEVCKNSILFFYEQISSICLEVEIDIPETPIYANSNVSALSRILHNLLSNALRYGKDGQVVGMKLYFDEQHAWIEVWDRGKGIAIREQDLIFERLYTLEDSRNSKYQGSGLGLTITKRLVEKINGRIMLRSKPYEKTAFILQLDRVLSPFSQSERLS